MGWASGSGLLGEVVEAVHKAIPKNKRVGVYKKLIAAFEAADCDTVHELVDDGCGGKEFEKAFKALNPEFYTDDELDDYYSQGI